MTKHTAEPWERRGQSVYQEDDGTPGKAKHVAECHGVEDSARIAACINACAGIPTEALEAGALAALVAEATETLRNIACADGVATGLTQDVEALEAALAKLRGE